MESDLLRQVWQRASRRCEYCQLAQDDDDRTFEVDHIISEKHHGATLLGSLALSCFRCNSFKGSNISGIDVITGKLTPLFNPRRHKWKRHFRWDGPYLIGRTAIGRTTVDVLRINDPFRVRVRVALNEEGHSPPG